MRNFSDFGEVIKETSRQDELSDRQILEWLRPYAKKLEIIVEELALNLHEQDIFKFDNIRKLLGIE